MGIEEEKNKKYNKSNVKKGKGRDGSEFKGRICFFCEPKTPSASASPKKTDEMKRSKIAEWMIWTDRKSVV